MSENQRQLQLDIQNVPNYPVRVETCEAVLLPSGDVKITGTVINTSLTRVQAPYLYFTVHDRFGMILREENVAAGVKALQGGEETTIEVHIPDCAGSSNFVRVFAST
jgi:hypothetical protein